MTLEENSVDNKTLDELILQISNVHQTIQEEAIRSVSSGLTLQNWLIGY